MHKEPRRDLCSEANYHEALPVLWKLRLSVGVTGWSREMAYNGWSHPSWREFLQFLNSMSGWRIAISSWSDFSMLKTCHPALNLLILGYVQHRVGQQLLHDWLNQNQNCLTTLGHSRPEVRGTTVVLATDYNRWFLLLAWDLTRGFGKANYSKSRELIS